MGQNTRQWKALMRKNFINWKRQPKCSFFEICCPAFVMILMVVLRNVVEVETFNYDSLKDSRLPTYPALSYVSTDDQWTTEDFGVTSGIEEEFFKYADYPNATYYLVNGGNYHVKSDVTGPLFFFPTQCLKCKSFQLPRVTMPIIAVVGESNEYQEAMTNYLSSLIEYQKTLEYEIQGETKNFTDFLKFYSQCDDGYDYVDFEFQYFETEDDLFDYTSAENYTFTDGNEGVCYGYQFSKDADTGAYDLRLYFNDQQTMGGPNSIGIPNTQKAGYDPLQTTPNLDGLTDYLTRGYSTLHNLAANIILKKETGSDLFIEASLNRGTVRMFALISFCFTQQSGFKFIAALCKEFQQVEMLEQCGDFYKLRTPREDKSIGFLFGKIEAMKQAMNIQEYGVSQTSLEQIFQNFAQQSVDEKAAFTFKINALDQLQLLNPDRKSTMLQKRLSLKGRASERSKGSSKPGADQSQEQEQPLLRPQD